MLVFLNNALKATYLQMNASAARERDQVQRHTSWTHVSPLSGLFVHLVYLTRGSATLKRPSL